MLQSQQINKTTTQTNTNVLVTLISIIMALLASSGYYFIINGGEITSFMKSTAIFLQVLLGFAFIMAGGTKIAGQKMHVENFNKWRYPS